MEPTACFISRIVKFTTCMKCRKYQTFRRHPFLMHIHRNSPAIICYGTGTIFFQHHMDLTAVSCQMLIPLRYQQSHKSDDSVLSRDTSDIHTRTFADCFQSFQNRYAPRIISFLFCHGSFPFFHISIFKHLFYIQTVVFLPVMNVLEKMQRLYLICFPDIGAEEMESSDCCTNLDEKPFSAAD